MMRVLTTDWNHILADEFMSSYWHELQGFVTSERSQYQVFPAPENVFNALELTPFAKTQIVILGQDPYHEPGQAHGLAFSVQGGTRTPPSLRNIYKELSNDIDCEIPSRGDLTSWAQQGVLLLNTTLTVRSGQAASHQGHGWEQFTDHIISAVNQKEEPVVFILWGASSRKKASLINQQRHVVIESAHPSPLSARHGFFGSRPFSRANTALIENGREPINWSI
jgi:uracil-DNA glycosylase